jgi:hypothetical protein
VVSLAPGPTRTEFRLPPVLGIIGTLVVCAALLMGHLSQPAMQSAAVVVWVIGLAIQAGAFALALASRRSAPK